MNKRTVMVNFSGGKDSTVAILEALKEADRLAEEAQEDWIAVERMYLPERLIPFREIQEAIDAVLGGERE